MKNHSRKYLFSCVLLGILFLANSVNFHIYTHDQDGDTVDCDYCEFVFQDNSSSSFLPVVFEEEVTSAIVCTQKQITSYKSWQGNKTISGCFFNKPPPSIS